LLRAIVLDFDGTIVNSTSIKIDAHRKALVRLIGSSASDISAAYKKFGTLNRVEQLRLSYQEITGTEPTDEIVTRLVESYGTYCAERSDEVSLFSGWAEFASWARERYPLAIASNAPHDEVVTQCRSLGIFDDFRWVYGHPTSKEDALRRIQHALLIEPTDLLYVGDRLEDRAVAVRVGTRFRLIDHSRSLAEEWDVVRSFDDLRQSAETDD
jgi:phosphoglycolate phosphatase-like HAD superfamily hydrolase